MSDLITNLGRPELFEKFKAQLYKDYEMAGVADYTPKITSNNIDELYDKVLESVLLIERKDSTSLMTLLYRIDISQQQLKTASQNSSNNLKQVMAELIIKRILQKVILKEKYSS
jgi:hypothetical protein